MLGKRTPPTWRCAPAARLAAATGGAGLLAAQFGETAVAAIFKP